MSGLFDITNGAVSLDSKLTFLTGMTLQDVELQGVKFVREIDMKTGWVFRTAGPYAISGQDAYLSLGFENDKLQRIAFSFASEEGDDPRRLHEKHDRLLSRELGRPSEKDERNTIYRYPWGEITSEIDPRGGSCQILVRWA